jgi:hypothetical protein
MEKKKEINYLDITDDEKSVPVSDDSSSSFYSDSDSSKPKKTKKKRSRSRSRKHKKRDKKEKKNKKDKKSKKEKEKRHKRDKYQSESPRRNKWSTVETTDKEPQLVKVPIKKTKKNVNLSVIKPNENIKLEEKEQPNFNPKETILAKDTNTVKYITLIL